MTVQFLSASDATAVVAAAGGVRAGHADGRHAPVHGSQLGAAPPRNLLEQLSHGDFAAIIFCSRGLLALVAGAFILVRGASLLALRLGLSPLVVWVSVVAFGTSAPELAVTTGAVLAGQGGLAVGNAVGSNIFNVLFVLGVAALITPLAVRRQVIRQEAPIMIGGAVLLIVLGLDGSLGLFDGSLLLGLLMAYTAFLVRQSRAGRPRPVPTGTPTLQLRPRRGGGTPAAGTARSDRRRAGAARAGIGLAGAGGGHLRACTRSVGGDHRPDHRRLGHFAAGGGGIGSVSLRGERDIAVGNVVGSCVFNLFGVVGLGPVVAAVGTGAALPLPPDVARFDLWSCSPHWWLAPAGLPDRSRIAVGRRPVPGLLRRVCGYLVLAAQRHDGVRPSATRCWGSWCR